MPKQSKALSIAGWTLTVLLVVFLTVVSGTPKFTKPPFVQEVMDKLGWSTESLLTLGILEVGCAVLFLIPRTAVLGAILLTAYTSAARPPRTSASATRGSFPSSWACWSGSRCTCATGASARCCRSRRVRAIRDGSTWKRHRVMALAR